MRETRYLWIDNLPSKVSEEEIKETFLSHGKIQNVKIHEVSDCKGAVVAFMDIKSAAKAHEACNKIEGVVLKVEYCEPNGAPGLQRLHERQQNCDKPEWNDDRGSRVKSPSESHRNRSRSSSLSSTRSGRSNLTDVSKHGSTSRRDRTYSKVEHNRRKSEKERDRDLHDENSQDSGSESPYARLGDMRGLKITQLPQRSSDSSIKDGLFHDYKRFGKITSVEVKGDELPTRYAIVTFKRAEDAEKAFLKSKDKVFFGAAVAVERHPGTDKEDPNFYQPETLINEFHPKSTKTLFVGNLHNDPDSPTAKEELKAKFDEFGSILEVEIKKQPNQSGVAYAFIQYADINSVVRALHKAESIKIGGKPVKLGFGKSQPTQCLWLSNLPSGTTDGFLANHFKRYGTVAYIFLHPQQLRALVYFETVESAQKALSEQKNRIIAGRKLQADFASNRCQRHLIEQVHQQLTSSYHMRAHHPITDTALRLAYSHYMKSSFYHHYLRNFARYDDSRSRSRHMEDMELYEQYMESGRRGSGGAEYDMYVSRRSGGGSSAGGSSNSYPETGASSFVDSGNIRNSVSGVSSSKKVDRNNSGKPNGPTSESHYSRNRSDSPFSSKSSHSRDLRSRSRSPRSDRKARDSTNRSHNRSDSSHSGEGDVSADSSRQRVMRRRRSTTRGSHSISAGVGAPPDGITRQSSQSSTTLRREHRGPSSSSSRASRIQRLKSEVKPAGSASGSSTACDLARRGRGHSDDDGDSDTSVNAMSSTGVGGGIHSIHPSIGDNSSTHSGASGGHRSDDATDIGELIVQRDKLLREIMEMDGDSSSVALASTINSSASRGASDSQRGKGSRELSEVTHVDKLKVSQEMNLSDGRKQKEKPNEVESGSRVKPTSSDDSEHKESVFKRRLTTDSHPSRQTNGPILKPLSGTVFTPLHPSSSLEPSQSSDVESMLKSSPKDEEADASSRTTKPGTAPSSNTMHPLSISVSPAFESRQLKDFYQRTTQHSLKSDPSSSSLNDTAASGTSERKSVTPGVTSCVNASRDPRLAPQQYGNRLVSGNIPQQQKRTSPAVVPTSQSSGASHSSNAHQEPTERLTDFLQRFVQPVTAMAPSITEHMDKGNTSRRSGLTESGSPPPPPPPLPHHHSSRGMGYGSGKDLHQHSVSAPTSEKPSFSHDDASILNDCEDPELKSVMQKTSSIDKQIEELDMKISLSEIARATAPTIDLSKYRIRPRSDSTKPSTTGVRASGPPTTSESTYSSSFASLVDKSPQWTEESTKNSAGDFRETTATPSTKSQDTSEFVKSMLLQSSRNTSFLRTNPSTASVANPGTGTLCSSALPPSTVPTPTPVSTTLAGPWTSSPANEEPLRPVSVSTTSSSYVRLNSPPIVASTIGAPSSNVSHHIKTEASVTSSFVTSQYHSSTLSTCATGSSVGSSLGSNTVTVNSTTVNNRSSRMSSSVCSHESNSDGANSNANSHDVTMREPTEQLKSILKKESPVSEVKGSVPHTPTTPRSSIVPDSSPLLSSKALNVTSLHASSPCTPLKAQPSPVSSSTKAGTSSIFDLKPIVTTATLKRKHSIDEVPKKACKVLKVESEMDGNLFRPDSFLFANKTDVKKEKRTIGNWKEEKETKRPINNFTNNPEVGDAKASSPVTNEVKSQLPVISLDEPKVTVKIRDDTDERKRERKAFVTGEDGIKKKKLKEKKLPVESSDTGSKVDDTEEECKQDGKRKRKKKIRSKEEERLEKKEKRKKKKKLDSQILKKKTREKLKETEDKLKKLKQRKQKNVEGKELSELSDSIVASHSKKEKHKEKIERKCSNEETNSEDELKRMENAGIYMSMYDLVKTKRKAASAKLKARQAEGHLKDHKRDSKSGRRKSSDAFKKVSVFDSGENSVDETGSRASSGKSVISRKYKDKSSKNKRRRSLLQPHLTSDESDDREDATISRNKSSGSKSSNRFRLNSDEADDETDFEDSKKSLGKSGKKKPDKRKVNDLLFLPCPSKKIKKSKLSVESKKKKNFFEDNTVVKKRRKKNSSNKTDVGDMGKLKMTVDSVFSDVDTDSSTGTDFRARYETAVAANEESDESPGTDDGILALSAPKPRSVRTVASTPTTPSTEPMSDDAVMTDLSSLPPYQEKNKNPLKEALTSAHEESRKELKELQRESGSDRHRAIVVDENVEISEDLPSLEVMTRIVKSPSSIDDEPPAITTCTDVPSLNVEDGFSGSLIEETVIEEACVDVPILEDNSGHNTRLESSTCQALFESNASSGSPSPILDRHEKSESSDVSSTASCDTPSLEMMSHKTENKSGQINSPEPLTYEAGQLPVESSLKIVEPRESDNDHTKEPEFREIRLENRLASESRSLKTPVSSIEPLNDRLQGSKDTSPPISSLLPVTRAEILFSNIGDSKVTTTPTTTYSTASKPLVFPVEISKPSLTPVSSVGAHTEIQQASDAARITGKLHPSHPPEIKQESDESGEHAKSVANDESGKVEMVRYVQRIMERVSVDICEDNKGSGKRIKKNVSGLGNTTNTSHPNQNILSSIADRGLSDRKPISTTKNTACLLPPGCNIYLDDSKMLPNLPASVTLTSPLLNSQCPPTTQAQAPPSTSVSGLKNLSSLNQSSTPSMPIIASVPSTTALPTNANIVTKANPLTVTVSNLSSAISESQRNCNAAASSSLTPHFINQTVISTNACVNHVPDSLVCKGPTPLTQTEAGNSSVSLPTTFTGSRRVFTRRKRNSSSNNKANVENEREGGSWHAHLDEVLEKVVHGKGTSQNTEFDRGLQPRPPVSISQLATGIEDQLQQQKETDEAVRAIVSNEPSDSTGEIVSGVKKDVDPYEPNFDEPSPSEINRNMMTHSHQKRQDGGVMPNATDSSEEQNSLPPKRVVLETLLHKDATEVDKTHTPKVSPLIEMGATKEEPTSQIKQKHFPEPNHNEVEVDGRELKFKIVDFKDKNDSVPPFKERSVSETSDVAKKDEMLKTEGNIKVETQSNTNRKIDEILKTADSQKNNESKQVPSKEIRVSLQHSLEISRVEEKLLHLPKQEARGEAVTTGLTEKIIQTKPEAPKVGPTVLQQIPQHSQLLQQQQAQPPPPPPPQQTQAPQQQQTQQQPQPVSQQHIQIQKLQHQTQQPLQHLKFAHLLQQKHTQPPVVKLGDQPSETSVTNRLISNTKVTESSQQFDPLNVTETSMVGGRDPASGLSAANTSSGVAGTRKRNNRAMSQTALIHVEEILDAVAHDKSFDLTQYSKDAANRRRSNSGEDHYSLSNPAIPTSAKDASYYVAPDLRALTPRSVSAMVSSKVSAEDQAQLQAISQSHQASLASITSKVSIAPLVLSPFLKPTNTTIHNHSQQFQQTRPASAAASSDVATPLIAVEPVYQKLGLTTTTFSSLTAASISPGAMASTLPNKTMTLTTCLTPVEPSKVVHQVSGTVVPRHGTPASIPPAAASPAMQAGSSTPQSCQPFAVAPATATVEDRGHTIERIPNPGLAAVQQHHREQVSPRLPATTSSASPAVSTAAHAVPSINSTVMNPGATSGVANRPASNPVHLPATGLSDPVQVSHQQRNFLNPGIPFDPNFELVQQMQMQMIAALRQNSSHFNSDNSILDHYLNLQYLNTAMPASASTQQQFWPSGTEPRRDAATSGIVPGISSQNIQLTVPKTVITPSTEWPHEQLRQLQSKYHMTWKGKLALKNDEVMVQMLFVTGNVQLVNNCIKMLSGAVGGVPPLQHALKIVQRMRMEPSQLEGVVRKMEEDHCMLLAVPSGDDIAELETQSNILTNSFIKYLQEKTAAGIINVNHVESQQGAYVVHIFPPGDFSRERLKACSSDIQTACGEFPHLLVIITTV